MLEKNAILLAIYQHLINKLDGNSIPVSLRPYTEASTKQDDPFDGWVREGIREVFPQYDIVETGPLMTPDIIIHDPQTNLFLSIEVKKLTQKRNGRDPRGLTLDYNSSLPCGTTLIKVGRETIAIPCFYLFALLSPDNSRIVSSILMDGDFLNYDFNAHKEAKLANISEYRHGPYGEGSVRHRRMYTYPNPLNSNLLFLHLRHTLVGKRQEFVATPMGTQATDLVIREDIYGEAFHYLVIDGTRPANSTLEVDSLPTHNDIFRACKDRPQKERVASIPQFVPRRSQGTQGTLL